MKTDATVTMLTLLLFSTTLVAQDAQCPPACRIDIRVPEDPAIPPETNLRRVTVRAGEWVEFKTNKRSQIRFANETPFVNPAGHPVPKFTVSAGPGRKLMIRSDSNACAPPDGCKYDVRDLTTGGRPVLDPYIIIKQ